VGNHKSQIQVLIQRIDHADPRSKLSIARIFDSGVSETLPDDFFGDTENECMLR